MIRPLPSQGFQILTMIGDSKLTPKAKQIATEIFTKLAISEGKVHHIAPEDVEFHEVGRDRFDYRHRRCGNWFRSTRASSASYVHRSTSAVASFIVSTAYFRFPHLQLRTCSGTRPFIRSMRKPSWSLRPAPRFLPPWLIDSVI